MKTIADAKDIVENKIIKKKDKFGNDIPRVTTSQLRKFLSALNSFGVFSLPAW